jgi:hypothetical protein
VIRLSALFLAVLLSSCATYDVHEIRDPQSKHSMIGMSVPDLIDCMGTDFVFKPTKPDEGVMMWTRKDTSTALKATLTLVGSVELGGGGGCSVSADVLRDGTAVDFDFPQSYNDGLLTEPFHACRALVAECLNHPGSTGLPKGYDAWVYLDPAAKKP